jgi:hypothetical protein
MSRRTLYVLSAVLIVLVALIALSRWSLSRPPALAQRAPFDFAALTKDAVQRIVIQPGATSGQSPITLSRQAGVWRVTSSTGATSPAASTARVKAVFDGLAGASFERLVAKDATDPASFGLTTQTAIHVALYGPGGPLADFLIGNETDVPQDDYVMAIGRPEIWAVSGGLKDVFGDTSGFSAVPTQAKPAVSAPPPAKP